METTALEEVLSNILNFIPDINAKFENTEYVLITINREQVTPLAYSNSIEDLQSRLRYIISTSLYNIKHISGDKYYDTGLDAFYDIINKKDLYSYRV